MQELWLDTETYNAVTDIKDGTLNYAATSEITLAGWAINSEPASVWDRTSGQPMPARLHAALNDPGVLIKCHNSFFDRNVLRFSDLTEHALGHERFYCTMVQAYAHGLPGGLDMLCQVFGIGEDKAKAKEGKALVRFFCKPDAKGKRNTARTHPEKWAKFVDYCRLDVEAMRAVSRMMPKHNFPDDINHPERRLWIIDQITNDRGFAVDIDFATAAVETAARLKLGADEAVFESTEGAVESSNQVQAMRDYLKAEFGLDLPDLTASTVERRLADPDLPQPVKDLLALRAETSKTSVKKYSTLLRLADSRGRLGGTLQFCGASRTGRDAGRGFQPQNLPRPPKWLKEHDIMQGIEDCKAGILDIMHDKPMAVLGSAVRGAIVAPDGRKLCISDLSNIEGRGLVWLSGEEWKLKYFRDFDAGIVEFDNYVAAYSKGMGVALEDVTSEQRQTGKVQELACFEADTLVRTYNGAKPLCEVTTDDLLWDGVGWVKHEGVVSKGLRETIDLHSVGVTPDHQVMVDSVWFTAKDLLKHPMLRDSAYRCGGWLRKGEKVQRKERTCGTREVFDILNSGPRHRFTIITDTGALIVHNCGYGGGVGGFSTFAKAYNMDLNRFAQQMEANADSSLWYDTLRKYDWAVKNKMDYKLPKYQWAACDYAKTTWRMGHPETVAFWAECEQAFRMAVAAPNVWHQARKVSMKKVGQWLYAKLPSGRVLCYLQPRVDENGCSYMGMNQYTRKWARIRTYAGKLAENFTQAVARDILMYNMPVIEDEGYAIVMRVHDELLTETPDSDEYSAERLSQLMSTTQPWCADIPLAAKGFETTRYRKD